VRRQGILRRLKSGLKEDWEPPGQTVGFNLETIPYKKRNYCIWDVSGKDKARPLWNRYFSDTIALIWVVDSSDHRRLQLSKQELHRVARDPELSKAAVLVYINKQDLRDGLSPADVSDHLCLGELFQRRAWFLQPCSAKKGDGLMEGFIWLASNL
jgi:signal recognition particle receptor subunit beta